MEHALDFELARSGRSKLGRKIVGDCDTESVGSQLGGSPRSGHSHNGLAHEQVGGFEDEESVHGAAVAEISFDHFASDFGTISVRLSRSTKPFSLSRFARLCLVLNSSGIPPPVWHGPRDYGTSRSA